MCKINGHPCSGRLILDRIQKKQKGECVKKHILFALLGLSLLAGTANAKSGDVVIADSQAKPYSTLSLNLNKLASGVTYNLSCVARSDHLSRKGRNEIQVYVVGNAKVLVSGEDVSKTNGMAALRAPLNSFNATGLTKDVMILVRNLDRIDTIFVERCVAKPVLA